MKTKATTAKVSKWRDAQALLEAGGKLVREVGIAGSATGRTLSLRRTERFYIEATDKRRTPITSNVFDCLKRRQFEAEERGGADPLRDVITAMAGSQS